MPTRIRDLAGTIAVLIVLFGVLISINPRVRDRAGALAVDMRSDEWSASQGAISNVVGSVVAIVSGYAADNTYLFSFLIVAGVLLLLMLRT